MMALVVIVNYLDECKEYGTPSRTKALVEDGGG